MSEPAPFFADMAEGPSGGQAWWLTAEDGVRIRVGLWNPPGESRGTLFLFPGRTEYIEKYGRAAQDLAQHGLSTFAIDWRGQGLADRLLPNRMVGHVDEFSDYQLDVAAMIAQAEVLDLPKPWVMLGHSMGGCIGLRAVLDGMPFSGAVFSGPMWDIEIAPWLRPVAWTMALGGTALGLGHWFAPGKTNGAYVLTQPFEGNRLTRDRDMYDYMIDHVQAQPDLKLGAPSLRWLGKALRECCELAERASPDMPCLTILGTREDIVSQDRIRERMAEWPGGELLIEDGGWHEVLMEDQATRTRLFGRIAEVFEAGREATAKSA